MPYNHKPLLAEKEEMSLPQFKHHEAPRPDRARASKYPIEEIITSSNEGQSRDLVFEADLSQAQEQALRNTLRETFRRRDFVVHVKKKNPRVFTVWVTTPES